MFGTMIEINGKQYCLKIDINGICQMKANGIDLMDMENLDIADITVLRELFFYAMQKYHKKDCKDLTAAGNLMSDYLDTDGDFQELARIITLTISRALGAKIADKAMEEFDKVMEEQTTQGK